MKHFTMKLDGVRVRLTPDGKVAVVDAIKALGAGGSAERNWTSLKAERIWASLKDARPEFENFCQDYRFQKNKIDSVVDGEGWERIEDALLDYILDQRPPA